MLARPRPSRAVSQAKYPDRPVRVGVGFRGCGGLRGSRGQWHRERGDYSAWLRTAVKDDELADEVAAIEPDDASPSAARRRIRAAIERRYTAPG